ncbi:MAG: DedA family protein [Bacteroidales bacterium]|nr:DedA family protein [Bacteroidales bacterium]MDD4057677.1 DedA family protein [Bacteroidales bacterium]
MELLEGYGFLGLFFGSFLAATVIPFSSDILIAGALLAGMNPLLALIWATAGNWLGGLTSYWIGHLGKWGWIEKWLGVTEEKLLKQKHWIDKYGSLIAFFSWVPFAGDILAVGLGFYRVNFTKSAIFMLLGKAIRYAFWVSLYLLLGDAMLEFKIL